LNQDLSIEIILSLMYGLVNDYSVKWWLVTLSSTPATALFLWKGKSIDINISRLPMQAGLSNDVNAKPWHIIHLERNR
jgi:hypothetical protein